MPRLEAILVAATLVLYASGFVLALAGLLTDRHRAYVVGRLLTAAGLASHGVALVYRWVVSGHLPVVTPYENTSLSAFAIVLFTLVAPRSWRVFRSAGVGAVALALTIMGYGLMQGAEVTPMVASLKSLWLYVHVFFAFLAYAAYSIAAGAAATFLVQSRRGTEAARLVALEDTLFRYVVFGFLTEAVMIAAGAIWAKGLWGSYWSWDPVETWSLVSWLCYGVIIHLRTTLGWRGRKLAILTLVAVVFVVIAYFGVGFIFTATQHVFTVPPPPTF